MGKNAMNANVVNNVIMPKKENMARIPSLASGESMPIMADITEMTNTTITPTRANTPIMPDIANMARAPIVPKVGTIPDTENMSDTKNMPGDMPRMANTTNTPIMPDMANMVRLPRLEDVPGISNHFTLPLRQPAYDWDDYRRAESDQYREERALAWWQGWCRLKDARREVEYRTARQTDRPDIRNTARLHQA
jgi:hypothetical protein